MVCQRGADEREQAVRPVHVSIAERVGISFTHEKRQERGERDKTDRT